VDRSSGPVYENIVQIYGHARYASQHRYHDLLEAAGGGAKAKRHTGVAKPATCVIKAVRFLLLGWRGTLLDVEFGEHSRAVELSCELLQGGQWKLGRNHCLIQCMQIDTDMQGPRLLLCHQQV